MAYFASYDTFFLAGKLSEKEKKKCLPAHPFCCSARKRASQQNPSLAGGAVACAKVSFFEKGDPMPKNLTPLFFINKIRTFQFICWKKNVSKLELYIIKHFIKRLFEVKNINVSRNVGSSRKQFIF